MTANKRVFSVLVLLLCAAGALASTEDVEATGTQDWREGWSLRLYAAAIDFDDSSESLNRPIGRVGYSIDAGGGLGLSTEYRFTRRLGVELGVLAGGGVGIEASAGRGSGASWVTYDDLSFTPFTVGFGIHLTPGRALDFRVSPLVAWVNYGSLSVAVAPGSVATSRIEMDSDLAPGVALGLGVPLGGQRWSFEASLTYLDTDLSGSGPPGLQVDSSFASTVFGVGVGYRF